MVEIRDIQRVNGIEPTLPAHLTTKNYVDLRVSPTAHDGDRYGDLFSTLERRVGVSQDTLSTGFLSFSGDPAPRDIIGATKLRFGVRGVSPAGCVIVVALHKGSSRTNLVKQGSDITVTSSFATIGTRELTIPAFSCVRGDFVYLSILRTGTGTPDPAMATSGGPATGDLLNPNSTTFVSGYKSGQSSIPSPLDTSAAFTASGRIFWFALAA